VQIDSPDKASARIGWQNDISISNGSRGITQQLAAQNVEHRAAAIRARKEDQHRLPGKLHYSERTSVEADNVSIS
jgi:hypothetical protein